MGCDGHLCPGHSSGGHLACRVSTQADGCGPGYPLAGVHATVVAMRHPRCTGRRADRRGTARRPRASFHCCGGLTGLELDHLQPATPPAVVVTAHHGRRANHDH
jgi:hypothetical protein